MVWVTDYANTLIIITIMGISRCIIVVLYPLVVADSVKSEEFPSAMGISMMIYGLVSIIMGPIIGKLIKTQIVAMSTYSVVYRSLEILSVSKTS